VWFGQVVELSSVVEWWCLNLLGGGPGNQAELFWFSNDEGFALGGCVNRFNIRLNGFPDTILLFHKNGNTFLTVELAVTNKKI